MVFEWFKKNYDKFYVKLLIVLKKKFEEIIFLRKIFLKFIGKLFVIYLKKNYYCYNII